MQEEPWVILEDDEYEYVWKIVYSELKFHPEYISSEYPSKSVPFILRQENKVY